MSDRTREVSLDLAARILFGELEVRGDDGFFNFKPIGGGDVPDWRYTRIGRGKTKERMTPIQLLALAVLRDEGDEGACAAFLDEVMESRKFLDDPVTEEWCKRHGWRLDNTVQWATPSSEALRFWVSLDSGGCRSFMESWGSTYSVPGIVTVRQVVQLCRALGIPWSASDPLSK